MGMNPEDGLQASRKCPWRDGHICIDLRSMTQAAIFLEFARYEEAPPTSSKRSSKRPTARSRRKGHPT